MNDPRVTVFMPVYNAGPFLREAIDSILGQTFQDFELLIIDDLSTDDGPKVIDTYRDPRIRFIRNQIKGRLPILKNQGLSLARGDLFCTMDADDISLPRRLEMQVAFLDANPAIGLVGTRGRTFGGTSSWEYSFPTRPDLIKCALLFGPAFIDPSPMIRRGLLSRHGIGWDESFLRDGSDNDFLFRCAISFPVANLPEMLYLHRQRSDSLSCSGRRDPAHKMDLARDYSRKALSHLGVDCSPEELELHALLTRPLTTASRDLLDRSRAWFLRMQEANLRHGRFPESAFSQVLGARWFHLCTLAGNLGLTALRVYHGGRFPRDLIGRRELLLFGLGCLRATLLPESRPDTDSP